MKEKARCPKGFVFVKSMRKDLVSEVERLDWTGLDLTWLDIVMI